MSLKTIVESLDAVPEALREFYTERDGKYVLTASDLKEHPDVLGLQRNRDAVLAEKKRVADELAAFQALGLSAEEIREIVSAREKDEEGKLREKGNFEELKAKITEKYAGELSAKEQEIARRDGFIERLLIDNRLDAALTKAEVLPEYREAVKALLKSHGPKVIAVGDEYRAVVPTDMGDAEIATYVEEWARTEAATAFLRPKGLAGSGALGGSKNGGSQANPFKPETRNLTEQARLVRESPELAKRLAAQAGLNLNL